MGAGWIRTTSGDYGAAFWISGTLCLIAGALALAVGRGAPGFGRALSAVPVEA
jgi:hypothetical protein